jgi:hypothetical protein
MKKLTIGLIVLTLMAGSAFAGDIRPEGLKAQVDAMKQEVPTRFKCLLDDIKTRYPNSDDGEMKLFVLKQNVKAYWNIREADYPQDILVDILTRYECDFDMVEFLVKKELKASSELDSLLN